MDLCFGSFSKGLMTKKKFQIHKGFRYSISLPPIRILKVMQNLLDFIACETLT